MAYRSCYRQRYMIMCSQVAVHIIAGNAKPRQCAPLLVGIFAGEHISLGMEWMPNATLAAALPSLQQALERIQTMIHTVPSPSATADDDSKFDAQLIFLANVTRSVILPLCLQLCILHKVNYRSFSSCSYIGV